MAGATALLITPERLPEPTAVVMGLARRDLTVAWARNAAEALQLLPRETPQVVLLDLATADAAPDQGGGDALQLCQHVRVLTQVPILVLGSPHDRARVLRALALGADAFLLKPVDPELLVAALAALRRRQTLEVEEAPLVVVRVRELEIDPELCEARLRDDPVALTPTEFRILTCLGRNLGRVVSARQLLQEAQGYPCTEREAQQIVKVHVRHLRRKLPPTEGEQPYIANVRGFGYLLERRAQPRPDDLVAVLTDNLVDAADGPADAADSEPDN
jgi:DNA-binding response OmpR family regulator